MFSLRNFVGISVWIAAGAVACSGDDPRPNPGVKVTINDFSADPMTVVPGQSTVLRYNVTNATLVKIDIMDGANVLPASSDLEGMVTTEPLTATTTFLLTASNGAEVANRSIVVTVNATGAAEINDFSATPSSVDRGASAMLAWRTTGAVSGQLKDESNAVILEIERMNLASSAFTLENIQMNRTITLAIRGDNGTEVTRAIQITVNGPRVLSFSAMPQSINPGDASTLSWSVANATSVAITDSANRTVLMNGAVPTGTFSVMPAMTETYTLLATDGLGGMAMLSTTVNVNQPQAAQIIAFAASPTIVNVGQQSTLSWQVANAPGGIEISDGAQIIHVSSGLTGMYVVSPLIDTTYTIRALNPAGNASGTAMVRVVMHNAPVINAFTVSPTSFVGMSNADLAWDVSSVSRLEIFANGSPLVGFTPIDTGTTARSFTGTFSLTVSQTTVFELIVRSAAGMANASATIATTLNETEPNDSPMTAIPLPGSGAPANGEINVPGDRDFYSITVLEGGNVRAETSDGMGGCATDTILTLLAPDGTTVLAENDDRADVMGNVCSLIDPVFEFQAGDLPAGTYYVVVEHFDALLGTGAYTLDVSAGAPGCGNLIAETRATPAEQCDDGNSVTGDGCDAACQIEPLATITGPNNGSTTTTPGSIDPIGDLDFIKIVMTAEGYIRAETFAPQSPTCTNTDTVLYLFNESFTTVLGSNDEGGVGSCSLIEPTIDTYARVLPGTYWLVVQEYQDDATIPAYTTVVRTFTIGCGNMLLETGETCDDGNTTANDGCSATCTTEGTPENEAGGNNAANGGGVLTATINTTFRGALTPIGDQDWYAVVVPQGYHLDAYVTTNSFDSCAPAPAARGRVALYGTNGTTQLAIDTANGPDGNCGRIWPYSTPTARAMTAGTYFLRVDENGNDQTLATYYLHVRIIAPGCGNEIGEGTEECDDGNTTPNDGCSATCTFEINPTIISPPGGTATVDFNSPATFSLIRVNITQGGQSVAAVAADNPGATTCDTINTALQFGDAMFTLLGTSVDGGPTGTAGDCAALTPELQPFAADLTIGTYYVAVFNETGAGVGLVDTEITIISPACGNGILEVNGGEECEDGNTLGGDGCTAACEIEPDGVATLPAANPIVLAGAITPATDFDIYELTVTAPIYLIAETFAPNVASGCPAPTDTVISLFDSNFVFLGEDDESGIGSCSLISQVLPFAALDPGTYWLAVTDYQQNNTIPAYEIRFSSVARVPMTAETEPNNSAATAQSLGMLAPGTDFDMSGAISALTDNDYFTFTLTAPTTAFFATHLTPGDLNSCGANDDTQLWIYNGVPSNLEAITSATEPTLVGYDDDEGFGNCSQINGVNPVPTRINLAAGTYYVRVRSYDQQTTIASYLLRIDL